MAQETSLMSPGPSIPLPCYFLVVVCSPHNPPYEQLIIGMGVGAVALSVIIWPWWSWSLWWGPGAHSSLLSVLLWDSVWGGLSVSV